MTRVLAKVMDFLNVREGEGFRVFSLALYLVLTVSTFITGRIQRDSLFLSVFQKEDLAYMYISVAVMVPLPALVFARVADRFRRDRLLVITLLATVVAMGVMRLLLMSQARFVYVLLYNFVEVYGTFLILQFWTFAGDLFSSREAKRLFPIVSAGSVVAGIVCGLAVSGLVSTIGTENLLFLQMCLLSAGAVIISTVGRRERARLKDVAALQQVTSPKKRERGFAMRSQTKSVLNSKHLKIIAGMTVATFVTVPLIDYQFKVLVKEHFTIDGVTNADAVSAFMGLFSAATGVIAAVMQLGLTGRVLERFGVVAALLMLPITLLCGLFAMLLSVASAFVCAVFTKGAENSFRYSITDATMQVLYTPVPAQVRGRAKTFIDAIIKPLAGGLAGAAMVLLVGPMKLPVTSLAIVAVVLVIGWLGLILLIRREYIKELLSTLRKRRLDFSDKSLVINDTATVELLRQRLRGSDEADVMNAIELCRRVQGHDLSVEIDALLDRKGLVRRAALELLADRSASERAGSMKPERIFSIFSGDDADSDEQVCAAAVSAYCALVGDKALATVGPFLQSPQPALRGAAVAGIIRFGGLEGVVHAADDLKSMLSSSDEAMRFACAGVLHDIAIKGFHSAAQTLMADDSPRVQLAAISAAGAMKAPELVNALIAKLYHRTTSRAAQAALAAYGDDVIDALVKVALDENDSVPLRKSVPRVLERIGSRSALDALFSSLIKVEDQDVRRELARSTGRLRDRLGVSIDENAVRRLIDEELHLHYQLLAVMGDLVAVAADPKRDLLRDALDQRAQRSLDGIFRLLGIIQPQKAIDTIWGNLRSTSSTARANAIEVLDNLIDSDEKRALLPAVEATYELAADLAAAQRGLLRVVEKGTELYTLTRKKPDERLLELLTDKDPWIVVCALHAVTELGLRTATDAVTAHLSHEHPLVRESALTALSVLVPPKDFVGKAKALSDDSVEPVRKMAQKLAQAAATA